MSHVIEVSVDDLGRILIPPELQSHLGLTPGMILLVEKGDDDSLRLSLQSQPPELVEKGGVLVVRAEPLTDLTDITRREREGLSSLAQVEMEVEIPQKSIRTLSPRLAHRKQAVDFEKEVIWETPDDGL